jgi:PAS domain S-box-containing protein
MLEALSDYLSGGPWTAAAVVLLAIVYCWALQRRSWRTTHAKVNTLQLRLQQALHEREQLYSSLLSNIPGAAYRCTPDENWTVIFISDVMERLSGWAPADYHASSTLLREFVHVDDQPGVRLQIQLAIDEDRPFTVEYRGVHRSGRAFWVWEQGSAARGPGGEVLWLDGVIMDISERKATELALQHAKHEAEVAAAAKTMFLANMGHEVRTPLNAILGFSGIVMARTLDDTQREHMKKVQQAANTLLQIVNDILDMARLERGTLTLHSETFSLNTLAHAALLAQQPAARKKGLALRLQADPALCDMVQGDARRLRQVLDRLLDNAVKFTDEGSVCLELGQDGDQLMLAVHDTGIGIAPQWQDRIFEAFTQADASMSRRHGGTGLGATIALQLVEHMGGTLRLRSQPGEGSSFVVRLPLAPVGRAGAMGLCGPTALAATAVSAAAAVQPVAAQVTSPWQDSIAQLIQALRSGEVADPTLPQLMEHLRHQGQETLVVQMEHALASFDLDLAAQLLETMPAQL